MQVGAIRVASFSAAPALFWPERKRRLVTDDGISVFLLIECIAESSGAAFQHS
jgi:hypothetical protein